MQILSEYAQLVKATRKAQKDYFNGGRTPFLLNQANIHMPNHNVPQLAGLVGEVIGRSPRKGDIINSYEVKFTTEGKEKILFFRPHELKKQ